MDERTRPDRIPLPRTARWMARFLALAALLGTATWITVVNLEERDETLAATPRRVAPLHVPARRVPLLDIPADAWAPIAAAFQPRILVRKRRMSAPSICVHCLRIHGLSKSFDDDVLTNGADVLAALTDTDRGKKVFGSRPILAETRYGARYRPKSLLPQSRTDAEESHIDQTLASLLECGVPLDQPIVIAPKEFTLRDVLDDAIASFDLVQRELEWSAVAISLGVPPATEWTNRFGKVTTFDDLARHLAEKSFYGVSCGGTHVFYAMVVLLRVDEQCRVLGASARNALRNRVAELVLAVEQNQLRDGSFTSNWFQSELSAAERARDARESVMDRLLITGHVGECLLRLPDDLFPKPKLLEAAGAWLWSELPRHVEKIYDAYCPLTHAAVVVDALRRR